MEEYELNDMVKLFGSKKAFGEAIGVYPSNVTHWGDTIPDLQKLKIWRLFKSDRSLMIRHTKIVNARKEAEKNG